MAALPQRLDHRNIQPSITQPTVWQRTGAASSDELFGRRVTLSPATCGYYDGIATSPVTCDTNAGYDCGFLPDPTAPNFGCCSTAVSGSACELWYVSTCLNNGARGNSNNEEGVKINTGSKLFLCGTDYPYCSTLVLYGESDTSYYSYSCQAGSGTTATAYMTADTTSSSSSSSSPSSSNDPAFRASATSSRSATMKGSSTPHSTAIGTPDGLSQGSKVGIGVGVGVGALALLAAVIAFFIWKRRSSKRQAAHPPSGYQYQAAPNTQEMEASPWRGNDSDTANAYNRYEPSSGRYADGSPKPLASEMMGREPVELSGIDPPR